MGELKREAQSILPYTGREEMTKVSERPEASPKMCGRSIADLHLLSYVGDREQRPHKQEESLMNPELECTFHEGSL